MRISVVMLVSVVVLSACADSQTGANGKLRFGQVVQYAETGDFTAGIAARQSMPLAIQGLTKPALLNDYPYLDGTLSVVRKSDGTAVDVAQTDTGKFKAVFPAAATYVLHAKAGGLDDTLEVTVVEQTQLRLAKTQRQLITTDANGTCTTPIADGATLPDLRSNQALLASIVPADAAGNPLLGVLQLEFHGDVVKVESSAGPEANSFTFTPRAGTVGVASVTASDGVVGSSLALDLHVVAALATCPPK